MSSLLSSSSLSATDLGVAVSPVPLGGKEFRCTRQTQMQIRAHADVHPALGQPVVQGMSAVAPFGVDEVRVVAGHRDTLLVVGHPESSQCAGNVAKGHLLLVLGSFGERRVGPMLLGDR